MTDENTQIILAGDVYIDRLDDTGQPTGMIGPLNTDALVISQEVEEMTQVSRMRDTFGQTRASVNLPQPSTISIGFQDQPSDVLSMALLGEPATLSEAADTVTDQALTASLNKWQDLPNRSITESGEVVTNSAGDTTYVSGTDYEMNYQLGMIRPLSSGSITEGQELLIDYTTEAVAGTRIEGGTRSQISAQIRLDGKNLVNGKPVHFECYKTTLRPDGEIDLNSGEFITTTLTGNMVTPTGKSAPFYLDELAA